MNETDSTNKTESDQKRCPRCGTAIYQTRVGTGEGLASGFTCWCCGWWQDIDDAPVYRRPVVKRQDALVQCSVQGCSNMVQVSTTTTGRCTKCNRLMLDWERGAKTKPAPLVCIAGVWIFNPERNRKN